MKDIVGLGKVLPIDKLVDILSSITSRLSKPYFDRKDADSKAYEIKKIAEAKAEEMKIISSAIRDNYLLTGGIDYKENSISITSPISSNEYSVFNNSTLEERAKDRKKIQEAKKQLNLESITAYAVEELKNEPPVTDEPLDEDWKTKFFNLAEDISSEEMQALWGRILAGEIKQPKSFSLRTLETLKNLSKDDAEVFTKFANLKFTFGESNMILNNDNGVFIKSEFGIKFENTLLLTELGLLASENNLEFYLTETKEKEVSNALFIGNKAILLHRNINTPKQTIKVLVLTRIGTELAKLIEQTPNEEYIKKICSSFKHPNVKIEYGDMVLLPNDQILLNNKIEFNE